MKELTTLTLSHVRHWNQLIRPFQCAQSTMAMRCMTRVAVTRSVLAMPSSCLRVPELMPTPRGAVTSLRISCCRLLHRVKVCVPTSWSPLSCQAFHPAYVVDLPTCPPPPPSTSPPQHPSLPHALTATVNNTRTRAGTLVVWPSASTVSCRPKLQLRSSGKFR